jgi:hypothetical protein
VQVINVLGGLYCCNYLNDKELQNSPTLTRFSFNKSIEKIKIFLDNLSGCIRMEENNIKPKLCMRSINSVITYYYKIAKEIGG